MGAPNKIKKFKQMKRNLVVLAVLAPLLMFAILIVVVLVQIERSGPPPSPALALGSRTPRTPSRVDVVYTWVDSGDAAWRSQRDSLTRRRIRAQLKTDAARWPTLTKELSELAISVKTVRAFMPWVHTIWVVTQRPHRINDPGLFFVHHDELLDPAHLPTFNSQAIETGIHKIGGLSEHFIYMNDDFFVGKPIAKQDLFAGGKPIMRQDKKLHNWVKNHPLYHMFSKNSVGHGPAVIQMRKHMGRKVFGTDHQIVPLTRTLMRETEQKYQSEWDRTQGTAFRDTSNIAPVTMACNHGLHTGAVHVLRKDTLSSKAVKMRDFGRVVRSTPALFCVHDITTPSQLKSLNEYVDGLIG